MRLLLRLLHGSAALLLQGSAAAAWRMAAAWRRGCSTPSPHRPPQHTQEAINHISMLANKVKHKMELQDKDNERAKGIKGQGKGSANERTRTTVTAGLKKKLKELMGEFSSMRTRIQVREAHSAPLQA